MQELILKEFKEIISYINGMLDTDFVVNVDFVEKEDTDDRRE